VKIPYESKKCRLTSAYGYRVHPIHGWKHFHGGIDLVGVDSDKIVAVADGTVVRSRIVRDKSNATWEWGEYIAIQGVDGVTIYYCHMKERLVSVGAKVKAGDVIGIQGMTGQATGPHLHFECRRGASQINAAQYIGIANVVGTYADIPEEPKRMPYEVGDKYVIKKGDIYTNGKLVPSRLVGKEFTVMQVREGRILLGEISSWVKV
jgi:murein DD-endopeptidase MepM/ murein hydrolase activator NlpD